MDHHPMQSTDGVSWKVLLTLCALSVLILPVCAVRVCYDWVMATQERFCAVMFIVLAVAVVVRVMA